MGVDRGMVFGLLLAVAAVLGANFMDGGSIASLFNPSALVLILGGTIGATAVSSRLEDLLALPRLLGDVLRPQRADLGAMVEQMVDLSMKARRSGLLSLEEEIPRVDDPFVARGLQMIVDGAEGEALRSVLQTDMLLQRRGAERQALLFETAGGFAPTMGIIGTVMGLIHVLGNLSHASALGPSIATAFLATFYGISSANLFWLPIANKMRQQRGAQALAREVALEGILSIQAGDNPSVVREKLNVFLRDLEGPAGKPKPKGEGEAAEAPTGTVSGRVA